MSAVSPGPELLYENLLCVRKWPAAMSLGCQWLPITQREASRVSARRLLPEALVVVAAYCVSGTGLPCEPLLSDYLLSARLCGPLPLTHRGCAGRRMKKAFSGGLSACHCPAASPELCACCFAVPSPSVYPSIGPSIHLPSIHLPSSRPLFIDCQLHAKQGLCSVL